MMDTLTVLVTVDPANQTWLLILEELRAFRSDVAQFHAEILALTTRE